MRRIASLVILAGFVLPLRAEALCRLPVSHPVVLAKDGVAVVGTSFDGVGNDDGEAAQVKWVVRTKTGDVKPVMITVAPGLVVYQLPDKTEGGELFDGKASIATLSRGKGPSAKLAAPAPTKITYKETPSRRGNSQLTLAVFGNTAPEDAIALIVVDAATMKPRSYGVITAGSKEIAIYGRGRCSALPNGTSPTVAGDKVILRWVTKSGALSADSKPITVAKA